MRIPVFLGCLAACCFACVSFSFGQTAAEPGQTAAEPAQAPDDAAKLNASAAQDNVQSEPSKDPQGNGQGAGTGTAARTKPSPTATAAAPTAYVFPTSRQINIYWLKNTLGPDAIVAEIFHASWEQWVRDNPREWTKDAYGWGQRYGTSMLDNAINTTILVSFSRAIGQDPRYHQCDCTGLGPRTWQAIRLAFMSYNRSGDIVFSPAKIVAPFTGPMVTRNTIYPNKYGYGDAATSGAYFFAGRVAWNLVREFIYKKTWL